MSRSFLMTTSPTIEGSEIEHYFGIVATNVVTGTGVFSDVAAAFSDFFGGRSNSYKKQLESIREEALKEIESKARTMGANAVVSLNIDNDQISGKNNQMLMISITATAVKVSHTKLADESTDANTRLSASEVDLRYRLSSLKAEASILSPWKILDEYKDIFKGEPNINAASALLKSVLLTSYSSEVNQEDDFKKVSAYLKNFTSEELKEILYVDPSIYSKLMGKHGHLYITVKGLSVFDYERLRELLSSESYSIASCALVLCRTEKSSYEKDDIKQLSELINLIEKRFPLTREVQEVKKAFKRGAMAWYCKNEHENIEGTEHCSQCGLSRRDLPKNLFLGAVNNLSLRVKRLKVAFDLDEAETESVQENSASESDWYQTGEKSQ